MSNTPIDQLNAALEGRYRIERELGAGGMATVYLARDLRHERDVALKVLRPELAAVVGAERFLAEIRTTANLQHPHILPLFDSGAADSFLFYVMPRVEGDTLRQRLDREHQLPVEEAIQIARDAADALDYAHRQGVVHRDIKPANILLHEGRPQVADFGIALALTEAGGGRLTETGLSMGTPHYMSPEQAAGERTIDARADVYALGCVLYEMLAGQPPFPGASAQAVLARILTTDPAPVTLARRTVPRNVEAALARALEKLPADRFPTARDFADALGDSGFSHTAIGVAPGRTVPVPGESAPVAPPAVGGARRALVLTAVSSVAATALLMSAVGSFGGDPPEQPAVFELDLMDVPNADRDIEISADGTMFATAAGEEGDRGLWVRRVDEADFRPIGGGVDPIYPAFSPESDWIVYVETGEGSIRKLMRVAVAGGGALTLVADDGIAPFDPHWGEDGTIVFYSGGRGVYRVPSVGGGAPELISERASRNPFMLPDGSGALVAQEGGGIHVVDLRSDSFPSREIIPEGEDPSYVDAGYILYTLPDGGLFAQPFDLGRHEVTGPPAPILDGLRSGGLWKGYSVSRDGTLVYTAGESDGLRLGIPARLLLIDRTGTRDTLRLPERVVRDPRLSPDGRTAVFVSDGDDSQTRQLYLYDLETSATTQLTREGSSLYPVWSPDGSMVAFTGRGREGDDFGDLYVMAVNGESPERRIASRPGFQAPTAWPSEGMIVFEDEGSGMERTDDLLMIAPAGEADPVPYLRADFAEMQLSVSPDGTLAAYVSDEASDGDVYVRSFPDPLGQRRVSTGGGRSPRWSPDGTSLFYWTPGPGRFGPHTLYEVAVSRAPALTFGPPTTVFGGAIVRDSWDVHPDGERLLVAEWADAGEPVTDAPAARSRRIVVLNWFTQLREMMGGG